MQYTYGEMHWNKKIKWVITHKNVKEKINEKMAMFCVQIRSYRRGTP
jgi:phage terminase small subunit